MIHPCGIITTFFENIESMQFKIAYFMYYYVLTCKFVSFAGGDFFFLEKNPNYIFITTPEYR